MDRAALIARKVETQRKLAQARRELDRLQAIWDAQAAAQRDVQRDAKPNGSIQRRMDQLQTTVEQLMAEEYRLRLAIDRA